MKIEIKFEAFYFISDYIKPFLSDVFDILVVVLDDCGCIFDSNTYYSCKFIEKNELNRLDNVLFSSNKKKRKCLN